LIVEDISLDLMRYHIFLQKIETHFFKNDNDDNNDNNDDDNNDDDNDDDAPRRTHYARSKECQ